MHRYANVLQVHNQFDISRMHFFCYNIVTYECDRIFFFRYNLICNIRELENFHKKMLSFVTSASDSSELTKLSLRHRGKTSRSDLRQVHLYRPCTSDIKYLTLLEWRKKPEDLSFVTRFASPNTIPRSRCSRMRYKPLINDHGRKNSLVIVVLLMARNCTV